MPPHPCSKWPLSANIADPVRASIICNGPAQILQAVHWFQDATAATAQGTPGTVSQCPHLDWKQHHLKNIGKSASQDLSKCSIGPILRAKNLFSMHRSEVHTKHCSLFADFLCTNFEASHL